MSQYINRLMEDKIKICLKVFGAINIVGPRYCGKTTTSIELSKSSYYFDNYTAVQLENILKYKPENILEGDYPRLIDEWQRLPRLWDITRFWVDQKKGAGLYLLTNSVRVDRSTIVHCGAGRIVQLEMDTMSLYESNNSKGQLSLKELFDNPKIEGKIVSTTKMDKIGYFMCRGGWPELVSIENNKTVLDISVYQNIIGKYVDSIVNFENIRKYQN